MDCLRKTGTDGLLKKELANGKLMIGESAGAIICAPSTVSYTHLDVYKRQAYVVLNGIFGKTGMAGKGKMSVEEAEESVSA